MGKGKIMNAMANCFDNQGVKPFEENVETPVKPVEPSEVEKTQSAVKTAGPPETAAKHRDEKLDLCMKNIKEFIRNIDVKSL